MAATRRLLVRDGYDQVSIDSIAREAGVSRPTVYRRWPSKAHVVFDAAFGQPPDAELIEQSGDFGTDLETFVRGMPRFWRQPVVEAAALGILADRHRDPELHIRTQLLLDQRTYTEFAAVVQRGRSHEGAVRTDLDVDILYQLLIGAGFYAAQVRQSDDIETVAQRMCALVIEGAKRQEKP